MKISIIIPTLNEAQRIGKLVMYLFKHGDTLVHEIIVVDGNSTDGTMREAALAGAKVLCGAAPSRARQMNMGAREATSDVLYFVHADTIPPTTFATDIVKELVSDTRMGCFRYQFDSPRYLLKINAWFVRFHWLVCQGGDKTLFISKEDFWALDGFNEKYVVMEEYDFLQRALRHFPLKIIPKNVLVSARKYEQNSWLRVQMANATAFFMFQRGIDPVLIREKYRRLLK